MSTQDSFPLLSWFFICSALMLGWLSFRAAQMRRYPAAFWFSLLAFCMATYCGGYAMELASDSLREVKFWITIEMMAAFLIPTALILMAIAYRDHQNASLSLRLFLLVIPALNMAIQLGNEYHHLMFTDIQYIRNGNLAISQFEFGPLYYLHVVYGNISLVFTLITLGSLWQNSHGFHKRQIELMMLVPVIYWVAYFLFIMGYSPMGLDISAVGMLLSGLVFYYALFHYRFIELSPIARELIFEQMSEAALILDNMGRISDFNRQAMTLFPELNQQWTGAQFATLAPDYPLSLSAPARQHEEKCHFVHQGHHYDSLCRPLLNQAGHTVGSLLLFMDVTERERLLAQLRHHAEVDELTGVSNRRVILNQLEKAVAEAWQQRSEQPLAIMLTNIPGLRQINEQRGQLVGDDLLRQLAGMLYGQLQPDEQIGRFAADHFLLIFPNRNVEELRLWASELCDRVRHQLSIELQLGMTQFESHDAVSAMLQRAELALSQARETRQPLVIMERRPLPL